jgi:hypothetical protein
MRRSRSLLAVLAGVLFALTLTSCGGGDETTTTPAPAAQSPLGGGATPPSSTRQLPPAFVRCMAAQGYNVQSSDDIHSAPMAALQQCFGALHG